MGEMVCASMYICMYVYVRSVFVRRVGVHTNIIVISMFTCTRSPKLLNVNVRLVNRYFGCSICVIM